MSEYQAYELPPPITSRARDNVQSYYIELAQMVWGGSTTRERKRWLRRDPLVYGILKGLGER